MRHSQSPIASLQLKTLAVAIASFSITSLASAAGLDRSGQDITAFFQDGTYAEAAYTYIDAKVTGHDNQDVAGIQDLNNYKQGKAIDDIAEAYDFFRYGVKTDINDTFSLGVIYDEPWGAAADYTGDNNFVSGDADQLIGQLTGGQLSTLNASIAAAQQASAGAQQAAAQAQQLAQQAAAAQQQGNMAAAQQLGSQAQAAKTQAENLAAKAKKLISANAIAGGVASSAGEGTNVEVRSENVTSILGMKFGQNKNLQIYGGPALQRLTGEVKLRGPAYLTSAGYDLTISPDIAVGWLAGVSYSKPEIALKAALTYRSEVDHETSVAEKMPSIGYLPDSYKANIETWAQANGKGSMKITTPESVNFDFQTGVSPTMLATAKVRWVPWSDFSIVPPVYNAASKVNYPEGLSLVSYDKDQWVVDLGLAKRLTPRLAVSGTVGWDSGAGNPTTSLGPIEGYYSAGLGAKYNLTENWAISAGGKYLWFGDAKGKLPNDKVVSEFTGNDGYILGVKLSFQDK